MPLSEEDERTIDQALQAWRQGDVSLAAGLEFLHFADLSRPHSPASTQVAEGPRVRPRSHRGWTHARAGRSAWCGDGSVRHAMSFAAVANRPFVEVAPLIEVSGPWVEDIRRLKRPAFAYVPGTVDKRLVADLDRIMTVEKAIVAGWPRTPGCETDGEVRDFAAALARKRSRFAFPDDFVVATRNLQERLIDKHNRQTGEGAHLRALCEIRVRAAPSWDDGEVHLSWWFIKDADPVDAPVDWPLFVDQWIALFDQTGRFRLDPPIACRLEDMTARDYVESDRLDLDRLSVSLQ